MQLLRSQYRRWRALAGWLPWTETANDTFGEHKARLQAHGVLIEDMDIAVAAIAWPTGSASRPATRGTSGASTVSASTTGLGHAASHPCAEP